MFNRLFGSYNSSILKLFDEIREIYKTIDSLSKLSTNSFTSLVRHQHDLARAIVLLIKRVTELEQRLNFIEQEHHSSFKKREAN